MEVFCKKVFLKFLQYSPETPVLELSLHAFKPAPFQETPTQMCSYEYCEIFKNTYFE